MRHGRRMRSRKKSSGCSALRQSSNIRSCTPSTSRRASGKGASIVITRERAMTLPIEDYGLIGDCKAAALVGRDGSIDWLCWPRFDSAACFAALLGTVENGRWLLAPSQPILAVTRHYRPGTLVLETEFQTETGRAAIIDFMSVENGANLVR